jgi:hypothetical protein
MTCCGRFAHWRSWLKVSEDTTSYEDWKYLKRRVLDPAVSEINAHGEEGGFFVAYEGIREGKAFTKVKFSLVISAARDERDGILQGKAQRAREFDVLPVEAGAPYEPTDTVFEKLRELAPGWDRQALVAHYREWSKGKPPAQNPHGAFLGWVKRFTKGKAAA